MRPRFLAVHVACILSGAAALAYEVTWARVLARHLGHTTTAVATVLATFMAGLALGSLAIARWRGRASRPLRAYALVEVGIACTAPWAHMLVHPFEPLLGSLYGREVPFAAARVLASAASIIVPSTLIGMTFPLLVDGLGPRDDRVGRRVGTLCAANMLGASLGPLAVVFLLMPSLGLWITPWIAAFANLLAAALAWGAARGTPAGPAGGAVPADTPSVPRGVLSSMALAGVAGMTLEVAWTRFVLLQFGSTQHAFAVTASAYILGLSLGALLLGRLADRSTDGRRWLGISFAMAGMGAGLSTVLLPRLAEAASRIVDGFHGNFATLQLVSYAACFLTVIAVTLPIGGLLPIAVGLSAGATPGAAAGRIGAWNSLGAMFGPVIAGLLLVPLLGMRGTILIAGALYLLVSAVLLGSSNGLRLRILGPAACLALTALAPIAIPAWAPESILRAPYLGRGAVVGGRDTSGDDSPSRPHAEEECVAWCREDETAVVSVSVFRSGRRVLRINGKADASNSDEDMRTQVLLGHLSMLGAPARPVRILVIGLGSGVTVGSLLAWGEVEVDCVEISPAVVAAARRFFAADNRGALEDRGVHVVVDDARTFLTYTDRRYDVIVSEPSNCWFAGASDLFSVEFYELCRERLAADGVMVQWLHAYALPVDTFKGLAAGFVRAFPRASLWETIPGLDYVLLSRPGESILPGRLRQAWESPGVRSDLERIGLRAPGSLWCTWVLDPTGLRSFLGEAAPQTDAFPSSEFVGPRALYAFHRADMLEELDAARGAFRASPAEAELARSARAQLIALQLTTVPPAERLARLDPLLARDPSAELVMEATLLFHAENAISAGAPAEAERIARMGDERLPRSLHVRLLVARALFLQGRNQEAVPLLEEASRAFPEAPLPRHLLATMLSGIQGVAPERARQEAAVAEALWNRLKQGNTGR